ncbi:4-hydroxyphenylpyruvate dioxygenase [Leptolyngbya sp. FACHB-261]|nr:4-hydroxyphenylpyruvate dioxygenase [Leptolyngbya sp. FACHB-261]
MSSTDETLELLGIDHLHFYVDCAEYWQDWFSRCLGFDWVGSSRDAFTRTRVVQNGSIRLVLSSPTGSEGSAARYLRRHPPGVAGIGLQVYDLERSLRLLKQRGATIVQPLQDLGSLRWAAIALRGSLTHSLIEHRSPPEVPHVEDVCAGDGFAPCKLDLSVQSGTSRFTRLDHVVLNLAAGEMAELVAWYRQVLGFHSSRRFEIQTPHSALRSEVMMFGEGVIRIPLNEPSTPNSQIQEFLDANRGPGVQHVALHSDDILQAVIDLRRQGVQFLAVPDSYYEQLQQRLGKRLKACLDAWGLDLNALAAAQILVDWHEDSPEQVLLQIFMQPLFKEPTFFFEIIQRRAQAPGFGERNFQALFEAIEREQRKRGSLR